MTFDRAKFFAAVRPMFGGFSGPKGPGQIKGLDFLLDEWLAKYRERTSIPQFAYVLATVFHETAATMQPIAEYGKGAGKSYGRHDTQTGEVYYGRGYVQLTWKFNYEKATKRLRKLGLITEATDFMRDPDLVMQPQWAVVILFVGSEEGWFTGRSLDKTIDDNIDGDEFADFIKGRTIINGVDKAALIANEGVAFLRSLQAATA